MSEVVLYARVSSERQAQQATVESQVEALKRRATADGHLVLPQDIYVDDGFSGATLVRPALERLRDRAAEGGVRMVYVHSADRLARKYAYQVLLMEELRHHGVTTVFLNGPARQSAEDELLVQVQGMIAEYERAKILERSRRGKIHRARQGSINVMGGAPYGYLYVKKSSETPASWQIRLDEARTVRRIFQALVHEQKSLGQITQELNSDRVPTRGGRGFWYASTVRNILKNPAYMGKAAFGKKEAIERRPMLRPLRGKSSSPRKAKSSWRRRPPQDWISIDVPAIVGRDVFDAAAEQLARNRQLAARNARGERYLLQGLTVCARCGCAYCARVSHKGDGRAYVYYGCPGTEPRRFPDRIAICSNRPIRGDLLEGFVWQSVTEILLNPSRVLDEWSNRQTNDRHSAELLHRRDEARRQVSACERSLKRLVDAYEANAIDLPELKTRSDGVRARVEHARRNALEAERALEEGVHLRAVITRLEEFAARVHERLGSITWHERRQVVRALVARIEIDVDGANIVYRIPSANPVPPASSRPEPADGVVESASCRLHTSRHRRLHRGLLLRRAAARRRGGRSGA